LSFELPLHVETVGPSAEAGTDVFVLLHGYGASSFTWRYLSQELGARGHVVLVDMKGFGAAPKPDDGLYGPQHMAELIHRLILQRGLERVTLVGHSLGGGVALLTALRMVDEGAGRLHRLVLMCSAAYPQRLPPFVTLARWPRLSTMLLAVLGPRRVIRFVLRAIVFDKDAVTRGQVEGYADPLRKRAARRALLWAASQIVPEDIDALTARFPELDVPTLLLWGKHDRVVPLWVGERLAAALPRGELEVLERCGHVPPEELPQRTRDVVAAFLDRTAGDGRG
jgi:pimeloyl-ACP methyl ester carboxylesterase